MNKRGNSSQWWRRIIATEESQREPINGWYGTCDACGGECVAGVGSWWHTGEPCDAWRGSVFVVDPPHKQPANARPYPHWLND